VISKTAKIVLGILGALALLIAIVVGWSWDSIQEEIQEEFEELSGSGHGGNCESDDQEMCWQWNSDAARYGCGPEIENQPESTSERLGVEHCWEHKIYRPYVSVGPNTLSFESVELVERNRAQDLINLGWNSPQDTPATYFLTSDLSSDSLEVVKKGIQTAEEYLGSYGPMRVYIIGSDTSVTDAAIEDYCSWSYNNDEMNMCRDDQGVAIYEMAYYQGSNAFAQHSRGRSEPTQAFVIGNPLGADSSKIAAHEYVHIYTQAHQLHGRADVYGMEWPIWIEEGSAEFLALYLADQKGWLSFEDRMEEALSSSRDLRDLVPNLTIQDIADDRGRVREYCGLCFGHLQYETGQWATAWLVHQSSLDNFFLEFFPNAYELGIDGAFEEAFDLSIEEFYIEFEKFMELPFDQQMAILPITSRT